MEKSKLSVVTCVYNTSVEMLRNCLLSIKNSLTKELDVIIVDDGSTVDYSNLQKEFNDFNWFKTENQGTLKAREFGAKKAKSQLICFVDSDDEVSFDYFSGFIKEYSNSSTEIIVNDWAFWTEQTRYYCGNDSTINGNFRLKNEDVLLKYFQSSGYEHSYFVVWNKAFNREVILKAFKKIEKYKLGKFVFSEDVLMTYFAFSLAKSVANIHTGFYFYRIHNSQQINATTQSKLEHQIKSNAKTFEIIEDDLKNANRLDEFKNNLITWKHLIACSFFATAKNTNNIMLFDLIKKIYNEEKFSKMPSRADYFYGNHKVLPINFLEIDKQIKKICEENINNCIVFYDKKDYTYKRIAQINKYLGYNIEVINKKIEGIIFLEKEKYNIKQKIIHNNLVFFIGIRLFPKGSKIRKFLKSKL